MPKVEGNRTMLSVRQVCSIAAGVVLCRWVSVPLSAWLSVSLWLRITSPEQPVLALSTNLLLLAVAFSASGFVTGLIVSFLGPNRRIGIAMLTAVLIIAWHVIETGLFPFWLGVSAVYKTYSVLEDLIFAICLFAFATMGAWLMARKQQMGTLTCAGQQGTS